MKNKIIIFLGIIIFSCRENKVQHVLVNEINKSFLDQSKIIGKYQEKKEEFYLRSILKKYPNEKFQITNNGFWIKNYKSNNNLNAKPLDYVKYTAEISNIEGNIIYSFQEFGIKNTILTKHHEIRAIEAALQNMGKDEEVIILLTSFNGYGVHGDENRINSNTPLRIHLKLLDLKKNH